MQEVRAGFVCNVSGRGPAEDEFGGQETDDAAGPVEGDTCPLSQIFQRDLPGDNGEEGEVKGDLEG
jgi:hypothetical protein